MVVENRCVLAIEKMVFIFEDATSLSTCGAIRTVILCIIKFIPVLRAILRNFDSCVKDFN